MQKWKLMTKLNHSLFDWLCSTNLVGFSWIQLLSQLKNSTGSLTLVNIQVNTSTIDMGRILQFWCSLIPILEDCINGKSIKPNIRRLSGGYPFWTDLSQQIRGQSSSKSGLICFSSCWWKLLQRTWQLLNSAAFQVSKELAKIIMEPFLRMPSSACSVADKKRLNLKKKFSLNLKTRWITINCGQWVVCSASLKSELSPTMTTWTERVSITIWLVTLKNMHRA